MEIRAQLNYLRIAPRKLRLLADVIRGLGLEEAKTALNFSLKKGSLPFKQLLLSCAANAKNNFNLDEATLKVKEVKVDEGPKLKRWRARSKGRAMQIQKKTSHISLVLTGQMTLKKAKAPTFEEDALKSPREAEQPKQARQKLDKLRPKTERGIRKALSKVGGQKVFRRKSF